MITSAKTYTKKKKKTTQKADRENPRTNGKNKAIQKKSHTEAYTYTLTKREKGNKKIYRCFQSPPPQFWDNSLSIQVFHRCRVHQVDCGDLIRCSQGCWEKFPFLFFVCTAPGVQLWIGSASACRSPEGVCSSLRQEGVKVAAD